VQNGTDALVAQQSWLGLALGGAAPSPTALITAPLITERGREFPRTFPTQRHGPAITVFVDGGNGGAKIGVIMHDAATDAPRLLMRRIEVCHAPAPIVRSGTKTTNYRIDGGRPFRIGNPFAPEARAIRTGSTSQRLADESYREFLFAAIVDTLVAAGYHPPEGGKQLPIYFGYAVPTTEMEENEIVHATQDAVKQLRREVVPIVRADKHGEQVWPIYIENTGFAPQPQGVFYAMQRGLFANVVLDGVTRMKTLDIGFGHEEVFTVEITDDGMSTTGTIIGSGMIEVASILIRLVEESYGVTLNEAQAQYAIITATFDDGQVHQIPDLVRQAIEEGGELLLQRADKRAFEDRQALLAVSGGGAASLRELLEQRIALSGRRKGTSLVLPEKVTAFANLLGNYAYLTHALIANRPWKR
jgi:hypothetical protein